KSVLPPRNPDVSKRWLPWQLPEATSDGRSGTLRTRDVVRVCSLFGDNVKTEPVAFARRFPRTKNEQIPCAVHDCHRSLGCSVCQGGWSESRQWKEDRPFPFLAQKPKTLQAASKHIRRKSLPPHLVLKRSSEGLQFVECLGKLALYRQKAT
ncbi:hypothetical protein CEXT_768681, partial [Caerostris extrusa]